MDMIKDGSGTDRFYGYLEKNPGVYSADPYMREIIGKDPEDRKKILYITVKSGDLPFSVTLCNFGASIKAVKMPDKNGNPLDIHYGFDNPVDLYTDNGNAYFGTTVGRFASIIPYSRFEIGEKIYRLTPNLMGIHHMHGGPFAFNKKIWDVIDISEKNNKEVTIVMKYRSPDGENGYPGNLEVTAEYTVNTADPSISYRYSAITDKTTAVNLINHAYWNPSGIFTGIENLLISIDADTVNIPKKGKLILGTLSAKIFGKTGDPAKLFVCRPVSALGVSENFFRKPIPIKRVFSEFGKLDHNFIFDENRDKNTPAASLYSPSTGIKISVFTDEPSCIIYSGNSMKGSKAFGKPCRNNTAVCIETCRPVNSVNIEKWKKYAVLNPGDKYIHKGVYKFSVD